MLKSVMAEYTMFSNSGRPVRAKVTLQLKGEMSQVALASWKKSFHEAFTT